MPKTFSIVFYGWIICDSHFISVYAVLPKNTENGFKGVLVALSPLEDETKQDANEHYEFLKFVLGTFSQSLSNVAALIGYNCSSNLSLAAMCKVLFIECASHRFNLAVNVIIKTHQRSVKQVHAVMNKIRFSVSAVKLHQFTPLKVLISNQTH